MRTKIKAIDDEGRYQEFFNSVGNHEAAAICFMGERIANTLEYFGEKILERFDKLQKHLEKNIISNITQSKKNSETIPLATQEVILKSAK